MAPKNGEKPIFKDLTIATAGDLGEAWPDSKVAQWVALRNGSFSQDMDESVTHLLCTETEFKAKSAKVREALKRHRCKTNRCNIVTKDWLEDSINSKRKLPVDAYSLTRQLHQKLMKVKLEQRAIKGLEQAQKFVNTNFYHLYADSTYFRYEVALVRTGPEKDDHDQKYILYLFESNAKPHLYWFAAKYYKKKGDSQPSFYRQSETPQVFAKEFEAFKSFFQKKTGVGWEERLIRPGRMDNGFFRYEPPTGGKPLGYVPAGFLPLPCQSLANETVVCCDQLSRGQGVDKEASLAVDADVTMKSERSLPSGEVDMGQTNDEIRVKDEPGQGATIVNDVPEMPTCKSAVSQAVNTPDQTGPDAPTAGHPSTDIECCDV